MEGSVDKPQFRKELLASIGKIRSATPRSFITTERKPKSMLLVRKSKPNIENKSKEQRTSLMSPLSLLNKRLDLKDQKTDDSYLEIPSKRLAELRQLSSEIWSRKSLSEQSNWDQFFESQTDLTESSKMLKDGSGETDDWEVSASYGSIPKAIPKQNYGVASAELKDKVFVSYITKSGIKCGTKDLSMRMEELADWLNEDTNSKNMLPISKSFSMGENSVSSSVTFRKRTIAEAVGNLDPLSQGLVFFVGPVDGKLCFKMSICDLEHIVAVTSSEQIEEEKKIKATWV